MSEKNEENSTVEIEDDSEDEIDGYGIHDLEERLENEKNRSKLLEEKLKRSLADFDNLQKRTQINIEQNVNIKIDELMIKVLSIYDDFVRAKDILADQKVNVEGLEAIIKNMNSLLSEYGVTPIVSLGEIFDPNLHEAISVKEDPLLDDGIIINEIRRGYKLKNRILRPSIVEISKKPNTAKEVNDKNG